MRGVIFTEFTCFLEDRIGLDALTRAIEATDLKSGGAYTSVGSYPYAELEALVVTLVNQSEDIAAPQILWDFGYWLAGRFSTAYKHFFDPHDNAIDLLKSVDGHIHVEVRKLDPDAVPPRVILTSTGPKQYMMQYESHRPLAQLALGLTQGAIDAYGQQWTVSDVAASDGGKQMTLTLTPKEDARG